MYQGNLPVSLFSFAISEPILFSNRSSTSPVFLLLCAFVLRMRRFFALLFAAEKPEVYLLSPEFVFDICCASEDPVAATSFTADLSCADVSAATLLAGSLPAPFSLD